VFVSMTASPAFGGYQGFEGLFNSVCSFPRVSARLPTILIEVPTGP
jgi:hypothetical protein